MTDTDKLFKRGRKIKVRIGRRPIRNIGRKRRSITMINITKKAIITKMNRHIMIRVIITMINKRGIKTKGITRIMMNSIIKKIGRRLSIMVKMISKKTIKTSKGIGKRITIRRIMVITGRLTINIIRNKIIM